jgi:DNA-binding transcriptional ArsR family regulator
VAGNVDADEERLPPATARIDGRSLASAGITVANSLTSSAWTECSRPSSRRLTCDLMVTYSARVSEDEDRVFKALGDPTRRFLLDLLFQGDGRTLTELESELEMTSFGVMKHLRVLEDAGLVITRRQGREKLHFLNPVPIRLIHDRWIDKYTERRVSALADLKATLEETG